MSLDTLLADIKRCDEDVKSAHGFLAEAQQLVIGAEAALAKAQQDFDRAVADARGMPYTAAPQREIPAPGAADASPPAVAPGTHFAPPLPPPVPVGPYVTGVGGTGRGNFTDDDNRPEGVGG